MRGKYKRDVLSSIELIGGCDGKPFMNIFSGLFIPHVTPFEVSGALDLESLTRLTNNFSSRPASPAWFPAPALVRAPFLSIEEKRRVYEVSGKAVHDAGKVHIATIAPQSTDEAISLMRDLESLPVDGVMIFSAATFSPGEKSIPI